MYEFSMEGLSVGESVFLSIFYSNVKISDCCYQWHYTVLPVCERKKISNDYSTCHYPAISPLQHLLNNIL